MEEAKYPSKERVVRDERLVYAEGAPIREDDYEELVRQGYMTQKEANAAQKEAAKAESGDADS